MTQRQLLINTGLCRSSSMARDGGSIDRLWLRVRGSKLENNLEAIMITSTKIFCASRLRLQKMRDALVWTLAFVSLQSSVCSGLGASPVHDALRSGDTARA